MVVRVKLRKGRALVRNRRKNTQLALAGSALLYPISLMAYVLGVWRLASDMSLVGEFTVRGFLAHWQVSLVLGALLQASAIVLSRYGRGQELPDFLLALLRFGKPRPESR
jgi:hypothetical protein